MQKVITNCSLDCFDNCSLEAYVEEGKITKLIGNKNHPFTKGMICIKGRAHLERLYHSDRILKPKLKIDGEFKDISYEEVFNILVDKLSEVKNNHGPSAVLHYYDSGYTGLSKNVDKMFFNYYGGATKHTGTLCWGAGQKAQSVDFGDTISNSATLLKHSNTILIWGRNVADTNMHMLKYLIEAKKAGAKLILIDPIKTNTEKYCDKYIAINPSTDGALALGMAKYLIDNDKVDMDFINKNIHGFEEYKESLIDYNLDYVSKLTGVSVEDIIELCNDYASAKASAIIIGYGMQRYEQGGNATRCINALASITGNIGNRGGGIYYNNKSIGKYISGEIDSSNNSVLNRRQYSKTRLADFLNNASEPKIKLIFVTKGNPILQIPNVNKTLEAFKNVEFKVVMDLFMTDTAQNADLVIPATSVMEEEDFFYSSMFSPYLNYSAQVIEPLEGIMGEYDFFMELAKRMELENYPYITREEFFRRELKPLMDTFGVSYEELKQRAFIIPDTDIAYEDLKFDTPSGKIELLSDTAQKLGSSPLPSFREECKDVEYTLRLLTPHRKDSLHSQHMLGKEDMPEVFINKHSWEARDFADGEMVKVKSSRGSIKCIIRKTEDVIIGSIYIYQGSWLDVGGVNKLTDDLVSDIGEQAAYYDCHCRIQKIST